MVVLRIKNIFQNYFQSRYEIHYIKNNKILLDFIIFFKTLKIVLNSKSSIPVKNKN